MTQASNKKAAPPQKRDPQAANDTKVAGQSIQPNLERPIAFMVRRLGMSGLIHDDIDAIPHDAGPKFGLACLEAFRIPFFNLWTGELRTDMFRDRLNKEDHPHLDRKYDQPKDVTGIYVPRGLTIVNFEKATTWMIIEGELKAAAAYKYLGVPVLGIGGCDNFAVDRRLAPEILACVKSGDNIIVIMDGDAWQKRQIGIALGTLARALKALGARVFTPMLSAKEDGSKIGFDDWLMSLPPEQRTREYLREHFDDLLPDGNWLDLPESPRWKARRLGLMTMPVFDKAGKVVDEKILRNSVNTRKMLLDIVGDGGLFRDQYYGEMIIERAGEKPVAFFDHIHDPQLHRKIERCMGTWSVEHTKAESRAIRKGEFRNLIGEWATTLQWDKTKRLATLFEVAYGVPKSDYATDAGISWWVTTIARVMNPGCKVDTMIVLVDPVQGSGKTHGLEKLLPDPSLLVTITDIKENKPEELVRLMQRAIWILLDEMTAFRKAAIDHMKVLMTQRIDHGRDMYSDSYRPLPRQCLFVGTTNKEQFLSDPSGNRRYVPVVIEKCDWDYLDANRDQLWAEAMHLYKTGYAWWNIRGANEAQQAARMENIYASRIYAELTDPLPRATDGRAFLTIRHALQMCGIDTDRQMREVGHVTDALLVLGFRKGRLRASQVDPVSLTVQVGNWPLDVIAFQNSLIPSQFNCWFPPKGAISPV